MAKRTAPNFKGFKASSEKASRNLSKIKATDTKAERILRGKLWQMGFRYRKNWPALPGKPDIVFLKERVAVFCDGDFWHGKNWSKQQRRLKKGANAPYWVAKIKANMQRDTRYNTQLEKLGWLVVRLWDSDIHKDINQAVTAVSQAVLSRRVPA